MKRPFLLATLVTLAVPLFAQTNDAAPVDMNELLRALKGLREQNESGLKTRRNNAYQRVAAAAASNETAVAFLKEAIKAVQFEGAKNEGAQVRDWREGDGEAMNDKLCQGAVRLHLQWLALTLQRSAGAEVKQMLPDILRHVQQVQADELAAEHFAEQLAKARDRESRSPGARKVMQEDSVVKRVHDQVIRQPVTASPVARWMQIEELLGDAGGGQKGAPNGSRTSTSSWENTPGNIQGIYTSIVLPEYRANKDPRLLDYWDMVLKRETDRAAERKLDMEQREWVHERRPRILWSRSQDVLLLGQKNRALLEMFNLIKAHPQHADAANWIDQLTTLLTPTFPAPATSALTPAATPGVVPAPVAIPPATGNVPAGVIVPTPPGAVPTGVIVPTPAK